jgi:dynein heavy chain
VVRKGGETVMRIGEKSISYDERFKLYMTTKLPNPHYLPDVCIKVTLINFAITNAGLEEQLLADVVKQERPDLAAKRNQLIVAIASDQKKVLDMEDRVLTMLSESTGNILDNEELISKLETSKVTSGLVKGRIEEAEKTSKIIATTREVYRPVATRGSVLYFAIARLAAIDSMYQYSLQFFQQLYNKRIELSERPSGGDSLSEEEDVAIREQKNAEIVQQRLSILIKDITWTMFVSVCRGLFEKDKAVYAFSLASEILLQRGDLSSIEWNAFLTTISPSDQDIASLPTPAQGKESWLNADAWARVGYLQTNLSREFSGLRHHLRNHLDDWGANCRSWFKLQKNDSKSSSSDGSGGKADSFPSLPADWGPGAALTPFQRLLLTKALRPDLLVAGTNSYVRATMGEKYGEAPALDLEAALEGSSNVTPLVFVLSSGADPMSSLLALAKAHGEPGSGGVNMRVTSLGQGQGPIAEANISAAASEGGWVCLQNCHLAVSWLPRLEQIVEKQVEDARATHADYRMWLTSMPCKEFPVSVLQVGIKLSMQPPRGVRANMLRGLGTDIALENFVFEEESAPVDEAADDEVGADRDGNQGQARTRSHGNRCYVRLLYSVVFYHACVLERRKFGGIGWNIPYEWMASDLKTGVLQLQLYLPRNLEENGSISYEDYVSMIPFDAINTMIGEISYGGRVTDKWDLRPTKDLLGSLMCTELLGSKPYTLVPGAAINQDDASGRGDGIDLSLYTAPLEATTREEMMEHVRRMPLVDDPRLFGLDTNANITCQMQESNELMDTILTLSGSGGSGGGGDASETTSVLDDLGKRVLSMFAAEIDRDEANPDTFALDATGGPTALAVVLTWEIIRFNKLIAVVRSSMTEMLKAIKGLVVMSPVLEQTCRDLTFQKVPHMWEKAAYPSLKPLGSWLSDLEQRIAFVDGWMRDARMTASFWISGLYVPQGFITGVKQQFARKMLVPIDQLKIRAHAVRNSDEKAMSDAGDRDLPARLPQDSPPVGVFIHGLFLQGAHWNQHGANESEDASIAATANASDVIKYGGCLTAEIPRVLFEAMPAMWLEPYDATTESDLRFAKGSGSVTAAYYCPIYKTTTRAGQLSTTGHSTNFVMALDVAFVADDYSSSHWVRRGVALICQLDS